MTPDVFVIVLIAAATHALWNTWLKMSGDRLVALSLLGTGWAIAGVGALPFVGLPDTGAWIYLAASTVVHTAYALALIRSYEQGSLSVAYPIARGLGPAVVTLVTTVFLGEALGAVGIAGVSLLIVGIFWLGAAPDALGRAVLVPSLVTGVLIGVYTLLDGLGGRVGESAHAYAAWLFVLTSLPVIALAVARHRRRFAAIARPMWRKGVGAGVLSAATYWVVIWAMSEAHMGLVAALRESSVLFAALLGGWWLRERVRWTGVALVFSGIVVTKLA